MHRPRLAPPPAPASAAPGSTGWHTPCRCRTRAGRLAAGAAKPRQGSSSAAAQPPASRRNEQLYELVDDDGWGVEVADSPKPPETSGSRAARAAAAAAPAPAAVGSRAPGRRKGTPFADMRSEQGVFGLTLLQRALEEQAAEAQDAPADPAAAAASEAKLAAVKQAMAGAGLTASSKRAKLPGMQSAAAEALAAKAAAARGAGWLGDEDEGEEEELPEFEITFDQGKTEMRDWASERAGSSSSSGLFVEGAADVDAEGEGEASEELRDVWGMSDWEAARAAEAGGVQQQQQLWGSDEADEEWQPGASSSAPRRQQQQQRQQRRAWAGADDADEDDGASLLADLSNEDDWGLEGLVNPAASSLGRPGRGRPGRRSLLEELAEAEDAADGFEEGSLAAANAGSVQWGGSAGTTGIDLEEQEELLRRYFRPDQVKKLMKDQVEIDASYAEARKRAVGLGVSDHKTQEKLRIVSGSAAGRKLISFRSTQTRPMMEKVRQAIFNMIQSQAGTVNTLPRTARWLDLFAGTGSVGLEALSRGVREAHFVEMDQVVVSKILSRNIASCGFKGRAWTHTSKAEDFLRRAAATPRFAGGPFDFVSVCPPYLLVSYPELYDLLEASPLLHPGSIAFVEYPKQLRHEIRDTLGPLAKLKDRKYGRTNIAFYAAAAPGATGSGLGSEDGEQEDPFLAM